MTDASNYNFLNKQDLPKVISNFTDMLPLKTFFSSNIIGKLLYFGLLCLLLKNIEK